MAKEEMFHYRKYIQARDKISFSNERRKSRRIAEMQIRNKKKEMEKNDGKVQAAAKPVKVKNKNPCMPESSKPPIFPKAFPIYSKTSVCGYLYMNNDQIPPTKVTLANIGAPVMQTLPNTRPLISAVHKPVVTPSKQNVEFLNNVNSLLLNNVPINPRIPAAVPNTPLLSGVLKPMDNNLTHDIPIQPKMSNTLYLIPVEEQSNGQKQSPRKFIFLSNPKAMDQNGKNLGSTLNNPTKSNNLLPLVNNGAYNKTDNSVQSISAHSSETQDSKVKCKDKTIDKICIKKEPTEMEDQYENKGRQSEFEAGENVHLSSDFIIETKKLNDECKQKEKTFKIEPMEEGHVHLSTDFIIETKKLNDECKQKEKTFKIEPIEEEGNVHLSTDFVIETKKLNDEYERKQKICKTEPVEEEEEGCGLVISSTFSLSDVSEIYDSFENKAF